MSHLPPLPQIHIHLHQSLVIRQPFIILEVPIVSLMSPRPDYALNRNYMLIILQYLLHTQ